MEINKIKALCDYLLGNWESEIEEDYDDKEFNDYFIDKYGIDLDKELNIGSQSCWKGAHIELSNLLDENNSELSKLLLGMVLNSSSRTDQNMKRINTLLKELYKKI
jgi:hypothetical protein